MHISPTTHEEGWSTEWVAWPQPVRCPGQTDRQGTLLWCIVLLCCIICSPLEITGESRPELCFFSKHPLPLDVIRGKNQLRLHKNAVTCLWGGHYLSTRGSRTSWLSSLSKTPLKTSHRTNLSSELHQIKMSLSTFITVYADMNEMKFKHLVQLLCSV